MNKKAYKFRIYPNSTQEVLLNKTFGCVRYAWNDWVSNFNKDNDRVFKTPKEFRDDLVWMKEVASVALNQKENDFREFKLQFFNKNRRTKLGRPKFKTKDKKQSYRLPCVKKETSKIRLPKIGWVKTVFDRDIPKEVKLINVTVSKDLVGAYFVSILVEENISKKDKTNKVIGIDVGLSTLVTLSTGKKFDNPRYFVENQDKIKRIQKHLSRKVKGSNRYKENKKTLAKVHRLVERQRLYLLHKISSYLVSNFDVIAIEDLNINGMLKNHKLAKSISDASWGELFRQLQYKATWYGKSLLKCERFEPTSKTCHVCGYYNKELSLSDREWVCPECNTFLDRDENAAINILKQAVGVETALQTLRDCKPLLASCNKANLNEVSNILTE